MPFGVLAQAAASLVTVLALVGGAGLAARWRLQHPRPDASASGLRLRASLALDARRRVHLIETEYGAALVLTGGNADQIATWPPG